MDLESNPETASRLCRDGQARLLRRVGQLTDTDVRSPSLLPGWTVGHVLTHLARNADARARRLSGALHGQDVSKYANGQEQRRLEGVFAQCTAAGWPNGHFLGGGDYGAAACPAHRLREVEMHHVDLGLGYTSLDWPDEYVAWDLPVLLSTAANRLGSPRERRLFMAWLAGRGPLDVATTLAPW